MNEQTRQARPEAWAGNITRADRDADVMTIDLVEVFQVIWHWLWLMDLVVIILWTTLAHHWHSRCFARKKTIVIYDEMEGLERLIQGHGLNVRYDVRKTVHVRELTQEFMEQEVAKADFVFLCSLHSHERNQVLTIH